MLKLKEKEQIVDRIRSHVEASQSVLCADYCGLTANDMTELRALGRQQGVHMEVARVTLVKRAFEDTQYACLHEDLSGPLLLAFSNDAPGSAAKIIKNFMKAHDALEVKALAMGGQSFPASQLDAIASLPSRDGAISMLASAMLAPVTKLAGTLQSTYGGLARVLAAVRDQKQS